MLVRATQCYFLLLKHSVFKENEPLYIKSIDAALIKGGSGHLLIVGSVGEDETISTLGRRGDPCINTVQYRPNEYHVEAISSR